MGNLQKSNLKIKHYNFNFNEYLDVGDILNHYKPYGINKLMIISDNGVGKTVSSYKLALYSYLLNGKHICVIRNTDLEAQKLVDDGNQVLKDANYDSKYVCTKMGIYKTEKTEKGATLLVECVGCFVYLSSLARSIPNNMRCRLIIIDEFIDGNEKNRFVLHDYKMKLKRAINRLTRPIEEKETVYTIMLANPHTPQCDLIYSFDIDFDGDKLSKGVADFQVNLKRNFVAMCLPEQFTIKEMNTTVEYGEGKGGNRNNYRYLPNKYKIVERLELNHELTPLFRVTMEQAIFLVSKCDNGKLYMSDLGNMCDFDEFPNYALFPDDKMVGNIYIVDDYIRLAKVAVMLNAYFQDNLRCSTDFGVECIKKNALIIKLMDKEKLSGII